MKIAFQDCGQKEIKSGYNSGKARCHTLPSMLSFLAWYLETQRVNKIWRMLATTLFRISWHPEKWRWTYTKLYFASFSFSCES